MLLQLSQFFPLCPLHPLPPILQASPTPVSMSMDHAIMFFVYSLQLLSIPPLPSYTYQSVPCFYVSDSILLISLFY